MSIIDRYVVRQVLTPFLLGLLVFTFIFIIPPLIEYAEGLVAKGVSGPLIAGLIALLIPQALAIPARRRPRRRGAPGVRNQPEASLAAGGNHSRQRMGPDVVRAH